MSRHGSGSYTVVPTVPTHVSAFTNDAGYLTAATVQDAVAIPTNVSAYTNDAGYITADNIPTNISAYTNDAGYITSAQCGDVTICDMANLITSLQTQIGQVQSQLGQMQSRMDALTGETAEP